MIDTPLGNRSRTATISPYQSRTKFNRGQYTLSQFLLPVHTDPWRLRSEKIILTEVKKTGP